MKRAELTRESETKRRKQKPLSPKAMASLEPSVSPIDLISGDSRPVKTNMEKSVKIKVGK